MCVAILVLSTRTFIAYLMIESDISGSIAVHPSGKGYASGGEDGFVRVHHFDESYFKSRPYGEFEPDPN